MRRSTQNLRKTMERLVHGSAFAAAYVSLYVEPVSERSRTAEVMAKEAVEAWREMQRAKREEMQRAKREERQGRSIRFVREEEEE